MNKSETVMLLSITSLMMLLRLTRLSGSYHVCEMICSCDVGSIVIIALLTCLLCKFGAFLVHSLSDVCLYIITLLLFICCFTLMVCH